MQKRHQTNHSMKAGENTTQKQQKIIQNFGNRTVFGYTRIR